MKKLRWTDVWILIAVYISQQQGDSRLRRIIAVADSIEHAVLNFEELASGIVRLDAHGYIRVVQEPWSITCTEKAMELVEPAASTNSQVRQVWKKLEVILEVPSWIPGEPLPHPDNDLEYVGFSKTDYDKEIEGFRALMKSR